MPKDLSKDENFFICASPSDDIESVQHWVNSTVKQITDNTNRDKIILFQKFPPEYVDCYQALQTKLAEQFPNEQDRPLICVKFKKSSNHLGISQVGMAGGTGPLSDAKISEQVIKDLAGLDEHADISAHREEIKKKTKNFTGVLYSFPPPRDKMKLLSEGKRYKNLYRHCRRTFPCGKLHILTNTGHLRKHFFAKKMYLGDKMFGSVDDLVNKVTLEVKAHFDKSDEKVMVFGTDVADKNKLYHNYFQKREVTALYPKGKIGDLSARDYLQEMIDKIKEGKIDEKESESEKTNGEKLVDFIVKQHTDNNEDNKTSVVLLACTELSLLKQHQKPGTDTSYYDLLKEKLGRNATLIDSEDVFVKSIANNVRTSNDYQLGTKLFKIKLFRKKKDLKQDKLIENSQELEGLRKYVQDYIDKVEGKIEKLPKTQANQDIIHKLTSKKVLLDSAIKYLKDPSVENKTDLSEKMASKDYNWLETTSTWGSSTQFLVNICEEVGDHILEKNAQVMQHAM